MKERLCIYCIHFCFDMGAPSYSAVTPGYGATLLCYKNKWSMGNYGSVEEYRKNIEKAATCDMYRQG